MGDVEGLLKLGLKVLDPESLLTLAGAPLRVSVVHLRREDLLLGHKPFQVVHFLLPSRRSRVHGGGLAQSLALPFATAANRPSQDAGQFGPQLVGQVTIAFGGRNLDGEENDADPPPEGGVGAADRGRSLATNQSLNSG